MRCFMTSRILKIGPKLKTNISVEVEVEGEIDVRNLMFRTLILVLAIQTLMSAARAAAKLFSFADSEFKIGPWNIRTLKITKDQPSHLISSNFKTSWRYKLRICYLFKNWKFGKFSDNHAQNHFHIKKNPPFLLPVHRKSLEFHLIVLFQTQFRCLNWMLTEYSFSSSPSWPRPRPRPCQSLLGLSWRCRHPIEVKYPRCQKRETLRNLTKVWILMGRGCCLCCKTLSPRRPLSPPHISPFVHPFFSVNFDEVLDHPIIESLPFSDDKST